MPTNTYTHCKMKSMTRTSSSHPISFKAFSSNKQTFFLPLKKLRFLAILIQFDSLIIFLMLHKHQIKYLHTKIPPLLFLLLCAEREDFTSANLRVKKIRSHNNKILAEQSTPQHPHSARQRSNATPSHAYP